MKRNMDNVCSVEGCQNGCWKLVCNSCSKRIRYGALPEQFGIKHNPPCPVEGCTEPRYTIRGTFCRGHYSKVLAGVEPATKRAKRKNGSPAAECLEEGCSRDAVSKGLCPNHNQQARYVPKTAECQTLGCGKRTQGAYCKKHTKQMKSFGISWEGVRPTEEIKTLRESFYGNCTIFLCETKESSLGSGICRKHMSDRSRKRCSPSFYAELMSRPACESCGDNERRLVVDHDHSCHPGDVMCEGCIRGRLCDRCNTALGYAGESARRLRAIADYIERFQ